MGFALRAHIVVVLTVALLASSACPGCFDVYVGEPEPDVVVFIEPEPTPDASITGEVFEGDFALTPSSLATLALYERVTGDLIVANTAASTLALSTAPLVVDGDLIVRENGALTSLVTGGLSFVGGDVLVSANAVLQSFSTTSLQEIAGDVRIVDDPALTFVGMSNVTHIGGSLTLYAGRNLRFDALSLVDGSVTVGGPSPDTRPPVVTLSLPAVQSIGADLIVSGLAQLITVSLPALTSVGDVVVIRENTLLDVLSLPLLTSVGVSLCVCANPTLDACVASSIASQLVDAEGIAIDVSGNEEGAPCE